MLTTVYGMTASAPADGPPPRPDQPLVAAARVVAGTAGLIGVTVIIGWVIGSTSLTQIARPLVPMAFNTAVCLVLLAATWFLPRRAAVAACAATIGIAAASLAEYATGVDLHVDQLIVTDTISHDYPGRMAAATGVCLLLLAASRTVLLADRTRPVQVLALVDLAISAVAVLGYAYGVRSLYRIGPFSTIALHTAVALQLLGLATLASVPGGLMPWVVRGTDAGGVLLRRLLPVALLGLPLIGWLRLRGEVAGLYQAPFGLAMVVVASSVLVTGVAWTAARALSQVDHGRLRAIRDLQRLTGELEDRVADRVAQVEAHHARIAVLEDRERIAADLHDLVVQRLFAAGVQLQSVTGLPDREAMQRRIDLAIDGIDAAISDLRASILDLKTGRRHVDLLGEVVGTLDAAQVVLGFRPSLTTVGPLVRASVVADDVLAVLREGLANVARHAHASRVDVTLRVDDGRIVLTIADDGVGVPRGAVDSGRENMRHRAHQHGGSCRWLAAQPHGTVVEWSVPEPLDDARPAADRTLSAG